VCRLTISSVVRESSLVTVVIFCRTGVVNRRNRLASSGASAATLRLPVLMIDGGSGPPGPPPPGLVAPGDADPPIVVRDGLTISPLTRKYAPPNPAPMTP